MLGQTADKQAVRDFVFAKPGASFKTTRSSRQAAATLTDWVKDGYFNNGFNGPATTRRRQHFAKGKGLFMITGSWDVADLASAMGKNVGFFLMPGKDPSPLVSLGGEGLPCRDQLEVQAPRRRPRRTSTSSRTRTRNAGRHEQPAGSRRARRRSAGRARPPSVRHAWQKPNAGDAIIPYLD